VLDVVEREAAAGHAVGHARRTREEGLARRRVLGCARHLVRVRARVRRVRRVRVRVRRVRARDGLGVRVSTATVVPCITRQLYRLIQKAWLGVGVGVGVWSG